MPKTRRAVSVLCVAAFLALPLTAQPRPEPDLRLLDFLSSLWGRLTETAHGVTSVWAADGESVPVQPPPPNPDGTGRGGWDPNG